MPKKRNKSSPAKDKHETNLPESLPNSYSEQADSSEAKAESTEETVIHTGYEGIPRLNPYRLDPLDTNGIRPEEAQRILDAPPMEDVMFSVMAEEMKFSQTLIQYIKRDPDIHLEDVKTQKANPRLGRGKKVIFDVLMIDTNGKHYIFEMQRDPYQAHPRRVRQYLSAGSINSLDAGQPYKDAPDVDIIFFTETDVRHEGKQVSVYKYMEETTFKEYGDGSTIYHIHAQNQDHSYFGDLAHDMMTSDPSEMRLDWMAKRVYELKHSEREVNKMLNLSEQIYDSGFNSGYNTGYDSGVSHGVDQNKRETAINLILNTDLSDESIAFNTKLSLEIIKSLKIVLKKRDE